MKILILEDEQRNAMRLIRLLNDIDTTFIIEGDHLQISKRRSIFSNQAKQQTSSLRISALLTA